MGRSQRRGELSSARSATGVGILILVFTILWMRASTMWFFNLFF